MVLFPSKNMTLSLYAVIALAYAVPQPVLGQAGKQASSASTATATTTVGSPSGSFQLPRATWGFADVHNHQFANAAFGGGLVVGRPFTAGVPVDQQLACSLPCCNDDGPGSGSCTNNFACPAAVLRHEHDEEDCFLKLFDSDGSDVIGAGAGQCLKHNVGGFPTFEGWPRWSSTTHQQVYWEWLKRAWQGGLRLMVLFAVDSEALCDIASDCDYEEIYACDDTESIKRQLNAAYALQDFIAANDGGWYRIAESPTEARQIIDSGDLAVVLGIETGTLFDCQVYPEKGECPLPPQDSNYLEVLDELINDYGVRHIFPIHVLDNYFGGAGVFQEFINEANDEVNCLTTESCYFDVYDCTADGYDFAFTGTLGGVLDDVFQGYSPPDYVSADGHCNTRGLTSEGHRFISELMDRRIIIDIDHMSRHMRDDAWAMFEGNNCYPVVSSHSGFNALLEGDNNHEWQLTSKDFNARCNGDRSIRCDEDSDCVGVPGGNGRCEGDVERIRNVGGIVAPIVKQGGLQSWGLCPNSSVAFFVQIDYTSDLMQGPMPFGTDFNGFVTHTRPRYRAPTCDVSAGHCEAVEGCSGSECVGLPSVGHCVLTGDFCFSDSDCPGPTCDRECAGCDPLPAPNDPDYAFVLKYPFTLYHSDRPCAGPADCPGEICDTNTGRCRFETWELDKAQAGQRLFDFNLDGLAHVGMLPDLIEDLRVQRLYLSGLNLPNLLLSADAYVSMWERLEGVARFVYVDSSWVGCGGGTPQSPYISIERGMAAVKDGGIIVAAPGVYGERLVIDEPLTIVSQALVE